MTSNQIAWINAQANKKQAEVAEKESKFSQSTWSLSQLFNAGAHILGGLLGWI